MATESDLVFSSQANHNFSRILSDLKRANLSITNRLRSIREDAEFVSEVANAFSRPLIANERCGSWYISPEHKSGSAYFKSTDGHVGQWSFSTRRLNLQLLKIIGEHDGCIVVDSTRRGKLIPDALSKTVPIWCCVLNRVLFSEDAQFHKLYTPPKTVSESEHAQMQSRLSEQAASLGALGIDIKSLREQIKKPLRPLWVTQETQLMPVDRIFDDFHPVVCCTSSRRVLGGEMSEGGYIQGAGDDTENWALGLTPPVFWAHAETLFATPEHELPDLVRALVAKGAMPAQTNEPKCVSTCLFVGRLPLADQPAGTCTISFSQKVTEPGSWVRSLSRMEVGIGKQKVASRNLRTALPQIADFVSRYVERVSADSSASLMEHPPRVILACESGKDLSVGVALALSCLYTDSEGHFDRGASASGINKTVIKTKLSRIMMAFPEANPSRTTLQSVNSFLMG
ncbi:initiator tRNA phosphoribosyl transferase [Xylariaceae sp. FL0016]|nr:initiator tRNA phosphoribosyl transferase [Xylariaceae sp. FL0016]